MWEKVPAASLDSGCSDWSQNLILHKSISLSVSKMKVTEFATTVDPDEVAHNEPPHLDLHCLLLQYDVDC